MCVTLTRKARMSMHQGQSPCVTTAIGPLTACFQGTSPASPTRQTVPKLQRPENRAIRGKICGTIYVTKIGTVRLLRQKGRYFWPP